MWWHTLRHGRESWRGNWRMQWVASTLHTTSELGVSRITTADAHNSVSSSRLNWRPRRFKWTRPFRRKTKSGFYACAITFQLASNRPSFAFELSNGFTVYAWTHLILLAWEKYDLPRANFHENRNYWPALCADLSHRISSILVECWVRNSFSPLNKVCFSLRRFSWNSLSEYIIGYRILYKLEEKYRI